MINYAKYCKCTFFFSFDVIKSQWVWFCVFSLQNYLLTTATVELLTLITYGFDCTQYFILILVSIVYIVTFIDDTETFFIISYLKIIMLSQVLLVQSFISPLHILCSYFYWNFYFIAFFCQYLPVQSTHWLKIRMSSCTGWTRHNSFFYWILKSSQFGVKIISICLYFHFIN